MGGEREQVDVLCLHIDRNIADCLHRISMEVYLVLPGDCTEFRDRFNRSDLIVGIHNRDQDCLVRDRLFQIRRINKPVLVNREVRDFKAFLFKKLAGMEHRMVLDLRCDDMVAPLPVRKRHPLDRPVVRLAPAGGEINLVRVGTQCLCRLHPCCINRLLRVAGNAVDGGGIAKMFREVGDHGLHNLRFYKRGCRVIHVDCALFSHAFPRT